VKLCLQSFFGEAFLKSFKVAFTIVQASSTDGENSAFPKKGLRKIQKHLIHYPAS
jgi:hypothetical protein